MLLVYERPPPFTRFCRVQALEWFQKCDKLFPTFKPNLQFLGQTYAALKRKNEAKETYERCLAVPSGTSVANAQLDDEVKKLMKKL